jgi:myo-inositol 2-dehydrogenase / D-chiro-inositol 1-dehydrogenase
VLNSQLNLMPDKLDWDAPPLVLPNPDGSYPIPMPGTYNKV